MGRQTARGAALVSITFTGLGKVLGYGRTLLIAWLFGASGGVDAFYVALGILSLLVTTASTVLTSTLLPVMANASPEVGRAFFVRIWRIFMGGTIVLLLGISLFPGSVVEFFARNFDPQRMHQAAIMLLWMIPWTVGMIHQSFLTVWSNLQGRYSVVSSILNIWNVVAIAFMWGAGKYWGEVAIAQAYSLSIVLVTILMWFVLADMPMSAQQGSIPKGLRRQFWTEVLICLGIVGSSGLFQVVDRYFGSALPEGNIAALGYASVVYTLPIQVLGPIFYVFLVKSSKAKTLTESQGQLQSALLLIWGYLFPCGCVRCGVKASSQHIVWAWSLWSGRNCPHCKMYIHGFPDHPVCSLARLIISICTSATPSDVDYGYQLRWSCFERLSRLAVSPVLGGPGTLLGDISCMGRCQSVVFTYLIAGASSSSNKASFFFIVHCTCHCNGIFSDWNSC